jgi:hypothetical protein
MAVELPPLGFLYPDVETLPPFYGGPPDSPPGVPGRRRQSSDPGADRLIEPSGGSSGLERLSHRPAPCREVNDGRIGLQGNDGPDESEPT